MNTIGMFSLSQYDHQRTLDFNEIGVSEIKQLTETVSFPLVSGFKVELAPALFCTLKMYEHCMKNALMIHCAMSITGQGIICAIYHTAWNNV